MRNVDVAVIFYVVEAYRIICQRREEEEKKRGWYCDCRPTKVVHSDIMDTNSLAHIP